MKSYDHLFGEVAIQIKLLTREQLARCLNRQRETPQRRLGEIAVELGFLRPEQARFVLDQQAGVLKRRASRVMQAVSVAEPTPMPQKQPALDHLLSSYLDQMEHDTRQVLGERGRAAGKAPREPAARPAVAAPADQPHDQASRLKRLSAMLARLAVATSQEAATGPTPAGPAAAEPPQPTPSDPDWLESTAHPSTSATPPAARHELHVEGLLKQALERAVQRGASDLHLHSGSPLLIRHDGQLQPLGDSQPLDAESAARTLGELMGEERWQEFLERRELDLAFALPGVGRFRVNAYMQQRGPDAVFRLLPTAPPTLERLKLPLRLAELINHRTGIVLCTGPTGCGKSTTLAALLDMLVKSRKEHIITVEDPIEFIYQHGQGLVNQRQIGTHTESFARALRAALREDPDIIGITELRDPETIALALTAAETGHLVLGSLHTSSAIQTITRIINAFPSGQQPQVRVMLSESLRAVISQRLVARADGRGRVPALEVLVVTPAVANMIREDKAFQLPSVMQVGRAHGMQLLDDSLEQLVRDGTIAPQEARRYATNPQRFA